MYQESRWIDSTENTTNVGGKAYSILEHERLLSSLSSIQLTSAIEDTNPHSLPYQPEDVSILEETSVIFI